MQAGTNTRSWINGWLWASAIVLLGLIVMELGRSSWRGAPRSAHDAAVAAMMGGGDIARVGDFSMLVFDDGNQDSVAVIDGRSEELFVFRVRNQTVFEFVERERLADIFEKCRQIGGSNR